MKFERGEKYRVVKEGAALVGMQPNRGGYSGWARPLSVGEVLTCAGTSMTFGDGVPIVKWRDAEGKRIANDCEFQPSVGGMWVSKPDESFLELVEA